MNCLTNLLKQEGQLVDIINEKHSMFQAFKISLVIGTFRTFVKEHKTNQALTGGGSGCKVVITNAEGQRAWSKDSVFPLSSVSSLIRLLENDELFLINIEEAQFITTK